MSHTVKQQVKILNLDALAEAAKDCGMQLVLGKTKYKWYGRFMQDYPLPSGIAEKDLGKCNHCIEIPNDNQSYSVGVVKEKNSEEYSLLFDFWSGGGALMSHIGPDANKLTQAYKKHVAYQFVPEGFSIEENLQSDGTIEVSYVKY